MKSCLTCVPAIYYYVINYIAPLFVGQELWLDLDEPVISSMWYQQESRGSIQYSGRLIWRVQDGLTHMSGVLAGM